MLPEKVHCVPSLLQRVPPQATRPSERGSLLPVRCGAGGLIEPSVHSYKRQHWAKTRRVFRVWLSNLAQECFQVPGDSVAGLASSMASETVLEVFKRFDADGSGSLSREELSSVLKSLDESLDDDATDRLLVLADASGDGELQVAEFLRWIFAEDQTNLGAAVSGVHDITLSISGCSLKKFNGDYVQQMGEAHCQRPVYYCASNRQLLFYCNKWSQWAIYPKLSNLAAASRPTIQLTNLAKVRAGQFGRRRREESRVG